MIALKAISAPLALVSLSVIKLSTLESVTAESSVFLIASLNDIFISELMAIPEALLRGVKVKSGGSESAAIKLIDAAVIALSDESSMPSLIAR